MSTPNPQYDVGDLARVSSDQLTNASGVDTNPTTLVVTIQTPSGAEASYEFAQDDEVVRDDTGLFHIDVDVTEGGTWRYRWTATGTIQDAIVGAFYARANPLDGVILDYVTSEELKATLEVADESFLDRDIALAITAASRAIDRLCNRRFYLDADATTVRYYTPEVRDSLKLDDLATATTVLIDMDGNGTWEQALTENADYVLEPLNAAQDGQPYTRLCIHPHASYWLPCWPRAVKVTGRFGWPSVPAEVKSATMMLASRLLKRAREAPFGIAGFGMDGAVVSIARNDPDVMGLVKPYIRSRITVA